MLNIWGLGLDAVKLGGWAEFPFPAYYLKGRKGEEEGTSGEISRVTKPNDPETIGGQKQGFTVAYLNLSVFHHDHQHLQIRTRSMTWAKGRGKVL